MLTPCIDACHIFWRCYPLAYRVVAVIPASRVVIFIPASCFITVLVCLVFCYCYYLTSFFFLLHTSCIASVITCLMFCHCFHVFRFLLPLLRSSSHHLIVSARSAPIFYLSFPFRATPHIFIFIYLFIFHIYLCLSKSREERHPFSLSVITGLLINLL